MVTIPSLTIKQLQEEAKGAESQLLYGKAIEMYEQILVQDALNEYVYDRLMIIYRKQKMFKKEHDVIARGIKAFDKYNKSRKSKSKKIAEVSEKLSRSLGLADKEGNALYEPEPIRRWKKRLIVVEQKLTKAKK